MGQSPTNGQAKVVFGIFKGPDARQFDPDHLPWPDDSLVAMALRGDEVIGRCGLVELPHIEGTWVAPEEEGTTLAFRLVDGIEKTMRACGKSHAFTFIEEGNEKMRGYAERKGYKRLPIEVYVKEL